MDSARTFLEYRLRPMEERDLTRVLDWRNSDRIRQASYQDHLISPEEHRQWFASIQFSPHRKTFVFEKENHPLGVVNIFDLDLKHKRAKWGFYLGQEDIPPGTGSAMGFLALDYLFEELGIEKLCAEVLESNPTSYHFHRKLGFEEEGRLRRHILRDGVSEDIILMAIFHEIWNEKRKNLEQRLARRRSS